MRSLVVACLSFADTCNLEHGAVLDKSIDARFARTPEELAVLIALSVEGSSLAINIFQLRTAHHGVTEERQVDLTALLSELPRLLCTVHTNPLDIEVETVTKVKVSGCALEVMHYEVGRIKGELALLGSSGGLGSTQHCQVDGWISVGGRASI